MKLLKEYIIYQRGLGKTDEPVEIGEATLYGLIDMVKDIGARISVLEKNGSRSREDKKMDDLMDMFSGRK